MKRAPMATSLRLQAMGPLSGKEQKRCLGITGKLVPIGCAALAYPPACSKHK
jgi:hypothetical protein